MAILVMRPVNSLEKTTLMVIMQKVIYTHHIRSIKEQSMKRLIITGILFMLATTATMAWSGIAKVEAPDSCAVCGMSRPGFAKSRMLITYEDKSTLGTCSVACVSGELAKKVKKVKSIQVGDYTTEKLIDAKSAVWVINEKKRGVMSPVAKWAFGAKADADTYIKKSGGKLATWDEVLAAACEEQKSDEATGAKAGCDCCDKKKK
jgi:copper chaperone NosL